MDPNTSKVTTEEHVDNYIQDETDAARRGPASSTHQSRSKSTHSGIIVFLRGFPSPEWFNHLGAALNIDPELFSRHLDVSTGSIPDSSRPDHHYTTPFPITKDLIQLRICNIGSWNTTTSNSTLAVLRQSCEASMSQHLKDFVRWTNIDVGDSIVRRFMLHDLHTFSIEQRISIEVIYHTRTWSIVCWMDCGKDLSHCKTGPWLNQTKATDTITLHPVFQHRSRMALSSKPNKPYHGSTNTQSFNEQTTQSIHYLQEDYGRYLKRSIMAHDAFYTLNELFEFSRASIDQLLELLEGSTITKLPSDISRMSELLIVKSLIDDYRYYVRDILDIVRARGGPKWPRVKEVKLHEKADRAASQLQLGYEHLLRRCERLSEQFASSIKMLMSLETQQQTEKAIEQTNRLSKLSVLAYFYIPLTFAASFNGMNFKELGTQLNIWTYFVMAIPLLIFFARRVVF
ncbi:MAG: hypothetical protein Q9167_003704 [Letrouitia subvulpina]